ncbi:hypothetical protein [Variovorax soli]|uniref:CHAT domain-containing protein n=1 Tax=Variovorax soli TaxID=376815 RepID=A0ABU1NNP5_9BURK|nr:hypothetical protein [Variovorax soli]MDR6539491.1 hypothetical protein [Variovorax soli]
MAGFRFGRIVIVQSLGPEDHLKSGRELFDYLNPLIQDRGIPVDLEIQECESASQFRDIARELQNQVLAGGPVPVLHVETHGSDDQSGLVFSDSSQLNWDEFSNLTRSLNEATQFNLLVIVAACFGAHFLLSQFKLREPSPFWGFIAPSHLTNGAELLGSFRQFYRTLLASRDASGAFHSLRGVSTR